MTIGTGVDDGATASKGCHCKKSHCLKLYCDCFQAGLYCTQLGCVCLTCQNRDTFASLRQSVVMSILERNPHAFKSKIVTLADNLGPSKKILVHEKGCNCKRTGCLKKYCECFQGSSYCSVLCRCKSCLNTEDGEIRPLSVANLDEDISDVAHTTGTNLKETFSHPAKKKSPGNRGAKIRNQSKLKIEVMNEQQQHDKDDNDHHIMFSNLRDHKSSNARPPFDGSWNIDSLNELFSPSCNSVTKILSSLSYGRNNLDSESDRSYSPAASNNHLRMNDHQLNKDDMSHLDSPSYTRQMPRPKKSLIMSESNPSASTGRYPIVISIDDEALKQMLPAVLKEESLNEICNTMLTTILEKEIISTKKSLRRDTELHVLSPAKRFRFDTPATTTSSSTSTSSAGKTSAESSPAVAVNLNHNADDIRSSKHAVQAVLRSFGESLLRAAERLRSPEKP